MPAVAAMSCRPGVRTKDTVSRFPVSRVSPSMATISGLTISGASDNHADKKPNGYTYQYLQWRVVHGQYRDGASYKKRYYACQDRSI